MNFIFPSKFVYWESIENHHEIKKKYLQKIYNDARANETKYRNNRTWKCKVNSSFFDENRITSTLDEYFYKEVIWKSFDNMLKEMNEKISLPFPKESNINDIWYNVYQKGEWQEVHDHYEHSYNHSKSGYYSGIYLIELHEDNKTIFYNSDTISSFNTNTSIHYSTEHMKEGTIILFPSELEHYVNPCLNKRVTISFNIISNF